MRNFYLLLVASAFICGVVSASLALFASLPPAFLPVLALSLFALMISLRKKDVLFILLLFLLVFLLGVERYNVFNRIGASDIRNCAPSYKTVLVEGRVASDPEESRAGRKKTFILEAYSIKTENGPEKASGFALVAAHDEGAFGYEYGDIAVLEGVLSRPFSYYNEKNNFDYKKYLGDKRIYTVLTVRKGFFSEKIGEDSGRAARIVRGIYSIREKLSMPHMIRCSRPLCLAKDGEFRGALCVYSPGPGLCIFWP
jgi:hypothetical protein